MTGGEFSAASESTYAAKSSLITFIIEKIKPLLNIRHTVIMCESLPVKPP